MVKKLFTNPKLFLSGILTQIFILFLIPSSLSYSDIHNSTMVAVIPINGEINRTMAVFVKRGVENAVKDGVEYLVFDINTFGGRVDSALQIANIIGSVEKGRTIGFVSASSGQLGVSWSAGALISLSCRKIYMAPGTSIGAAAPITMGPEGAKPTSEKVVSAVRAQMSALAEKNGYPVAVAEAMVDVDIELVEIRYDDRILLVKREDVEEFRRKAREESRKFEDVDIELVEIRYDDRILLVKREDVEEFRRKAREESRKFEVVKVVSPSGKLLTLTAKQMEYYGISSGTVRDIDELMEYEGIRNPLIIRYNESGADKVVSFLTSSAVAGLLIMIGIIALLIEITTPGFGLPGTIAIICFLIVFFSCGLLGTLESFELLLFIAGIILLVIELLLIPGFGITGVAGIILIVASLILSMQGFVIPKYDYQRKIMKINAIVVLSSLVGALIGFTVLARFLPKIGVFSALMLKAEQKPEEGFVVQDEEEKNKLVGGQGIAVTPLRPSGKAKIGDELYDVQTDGEYVEKGTRIEVIEVSGNRIVVKKAKNK